MPRFDRFALPTALLLSACLPALGAEPLARPNVVLLLIDNCGKEWLGCYGSQENCTPNIDRLAAGGLRVEHCYTPPVCGPSRITLLTGRYLLRSGMTLHHDAALYSGGGLDPRKQVTFARPLKQAGYATGIVGKWQINNLYDEPGVIAAHGFDEHLLWPGSIDRDQVGDADFARFMKAAESDDPVVTGQMMPKIESRYWDPVMIRNGKRETHPGKFGPDVFQEFALDFLNRHKHHPFLLYYPLVLTHGKSFVEPVVPTPLNGAADRPEHEMYADMVRYVDRLVGQVVEELERLGLREKTYVFVATDNGTEKSLSARANGRLVQGGLYQLTEAGGNVPLIVNCPALVPGGRTLPLADFSDVLPTICDLTGAPRPARVTLDGQSFASVLTGQAGSQAPRQWIFNQYYPLRVIRGERYKLYSDGRLFDTATDFEEKQDLSQKDAPEIQAARRQIQTWLDSLPPDSPAPFKLRSQSAFKLRSGQVGK